VGEVIAPAKVGLVAGGGVADDEDGGQSRIEGRVLRDIGLVRNGEVGTRNADDLRMHRCGGDEAENEGGYAGELHGRKRSIGTIGLSSGNRFRFGIRSRRALGWSPASVEERCVESGWQDS